MYRQYQNNNCGCKPGVPAQVAVTNVISSLECDGGDYSANAFGSSSSVNSFPQNSGIIQYDFQGTNKVCKFPGATGSDNEVKCLEVHITGCTSFLIETHSFPKETQQTHFQLVSFEEECKLPILVLRSPV